MSTAETIIFVCAFIALAVILIAVSLMLTKRNIIKMQAVQEQENEVKSQQILREKTELNSLSEKELMIEILMILKETNEKCDKIISNTRYIAANLIYTKKR